MSDNNNIPWYAQPNPAWEKGVALNVSGQFPIADGFKETIVRPLPVEVECEIEMEPWMNTKLYELSGIAMNDNQWDGMLAGVLTGTLIKELYKRYPELVGPLKDELEILGVENDTRN